MFAVLLALAAIAAALLYYYASRSFRYWTDRGVPQLEPTLPFGNMRGMGKEFSFNELLDRAYRRFRDRSPVAGLYFLTNPVLIVNDLDVVKQVLVKDFGSFHDRGLYVNERDDPRSGHLFSIAGERWRYLRNKLSPTFTSGKIKAMFGTIRTIGIEFLAGAEQYVDRGVPIDIKKLSQCFTCDVVGSCAFGLECNALKNGNAKLLEVGDKVFRQTPLRMMYSMVLSVLPRLSRALRLPLFPREVSSYFMGVVSETVALREQHGVERPDFLNLLIQLKNRGTVEDGGDQATEKLTLDEVSAQAFVFFFAGFETSSTTLSFVLFLLASHPEVQERCRKEILEKLGTDGTEGGLITYEALKEMTYVDQVINETLRIYPPVGQLMRAVTQTVHLEAANVTLKKGDMVMIPIYSYHHDPDLFPDPECFRPERFTPEAVQSRHPLAFLPFGEGPRNCIGMRFGLLEAKFGVVQLLSRLRFTVDPRTEVPLRLAKNTGFLQVEGGIWLNATRA